MQFLPVVKLLVLLTLANGTPIAAKNIFGPRFSFPLDGGTNLWDGRPLFGPSKTVRGILVSILVTTAAAKTPVPTTRVSLEAKQMQIEDKLVNLAPGMAVTVEIKTGTRRIIEYLMSPLLRYRQESLRER